MSFKWNHNTGTKIPSKQLPKSFLKDSSLVIYIIFYIVLISCIYSNHAYFKREIRLQLRYRYSQDSTPLGSGLFLRVEVDGGHWKAQVQLSDKIASIETCASWWLLHKTQRHFLLKQQKYVTMYSNRWPWSQVWNNLFSCIQDNLLD